MWEAYYRYYYKDGNYAALDGSRQPNTSNPIMQGQQRMVTKWSNNYRFGLDNDPIRKLF